MKRSVVIGSSCTLLLAIACVASYLIRSNELGSIAQANLPERPNLERLPRLLERRIASNEGKIGNGKDPIDALSALSRLYHANGFYDEAIECYQGLIQAQPDQALWPHRLASIYAKYGMLQTAQPLLERATRQAKTYAPAWIRLGNCRLKLNQIDSAAEAFEAALKINKDNPHALFGLARTMASRDRWEDTRKLLESIRANPRIHIGIDLLVTAYEKTGKPDQAIALRSQAMDSSAHNELPDPWISELFDDCYDDYQLALAAGTAERIGDSDTAIRRLQQAIKIAPQNPYHPTQLGILYKSLGLSDKAQVSLMEAIKIDPKHSDAWAHLVASLRESGQITQAENLLNKGLGYLPESYDLRMEKGRFLSRRGELSQANASFLIAAKVRFDSAQPWIEAATNSFKLERIDSGIQLLQKALVAEPDHPGALTSLIFAAISTRNQPLADEMLERANRQPRVSQKDLRNLKSRYESAFGQ